jgi:hypothetical protein
MYKGRVTETRTSEIPISTGVSNKGGRIKSYRAAVAVARQVLKTHRDGAVSYLARDLERSRAIMMPTSNLCAVTWVDAPKLWE